MPYTFSSVPSYIRVTQGNRRRITNPFFLGRDDNATQMSQNSLIELNAANSMISSADASTNPWSFSTAPSTNSDSYYFERFSKKVFVGGLPPDIDEDDIKILFCQFGKLIVDWPQKSESISRFPPKGYAFLLFENEWSVQQMINACSVEKQNFYFYASSPTVKNKPVQIRPWCLLDADFVSETSLFVNARKTVFVGGVPRPLKSVELAAIMNTLFGSVCYAGIDVDPEYKYPKGAGRVTFVNEQSYKAAICTRFVQLKTNDIDKRVEIKPYVLDDQTCDECLGVRHSSKFAPFFCGNVICLKYYCEQCWTRIHSCSGYEFHKPLVKENVDRLHGPVLHKY